MNFAKYIVVHILAKFKYFAKQIIYIKMVYHLFAFYEFGSHQNFQKWPFGPISRKSLAKLRNQNIFEKFKLNRNLQRIPFRMMSVYVMPSVFK